MKIAGLQKLSLIDYPGKIAAIVFTLGCNFRCPFCQNPDLVEIDNQKPLIKEDGFFNFLKSRKNLLDGVCITGGEPTIQPDLMGFIKKIKKQGFLVKLDTNGNRPEVLEKLFQEKLLDFAAMDIKCSLEKYLFVIARERSDRSNLKKSHEIASSVAFGDLLAMTKSNIQQSINLIRNSGVDYEFRTTVVSKIIDKKEIEKIGKWLKGSKKFALQQFQNTKTLDKKWQKIKPYSDKELKELVEIAEQYFEKVELRGI